MPDKDDVIELFRPVGQKEMDLIREAGFKSFSPRLPHQPIFYPVLNRAYAEQIARDWNTKDKASDFTGYVTRFYADAEFVSRYESRKVGSSIALEL